eukprot:GHVN01012289.1.p1 GENE.GHVN01012289.1~~GHVN01012289.1.p1  ORF type:complete len:252 (-),score=35.59 GHVN01012289.1:656-1411(-)
MFVSCLPLGTVVVLWDSIIEGGLHELLPLSIALFQVLSTFLLRMRFEEILKFFRTLRFECDEVKIGRLLVDAGETVVLPPRILQYVDGATLAELVDEAAEQEAVESKEGDGRPTGRSEAQRQRRTVRSPARQQPSNGTVHRQRSHPAPSIVSLGEQNESTQSHQPPRTHSHTHSHPPSLQAFTRSHTHGGQRTTSNIRQSHLVAHRKTDADALNTTGASAQGAGLVKRAGDRRLTERNHAPSASPQRPTGE